MLPLSTLPDEPAMYTENSATTHSHEIRQKPPNTHMWRYVLRRQHLKRPERCGQSWQTAMDGASPRALSVAVGRSDSCV
jgi:hypothetical protein